LQISYRLLATTKPQPVGKLNQYIKLALKRRRDRKLTLFECGDVDGEAVFELLRMNDAHRDVTRLHLWFETNRHVLDSSLIATRYPFVEELVVEWFRLEPILSLLELYGKISNLVLKFHWGGSYGRPNVDTIQLPILKRLTFIDFHVHDLLPWMQVIVAPQLVSLHIEADAPSAVGERGPLGDLAFQYKPKTKESIKHVVIVDHMARKYTKNILFSLPNVTELEVKYTWAAPFILEDTLDFLCYLDYAGNFTFCPKLEHLTYCNTRIVLGDLEELIRMRMAREPVTLRRVDLPGVKLMEGRSRPARRSLDLPGARMRIANGDHWVEVVGD